MHNCIPCSVPSPSSREIRPQLDYVLGYSAVDENEDVKSVPPTYEQVENFVKIATPISEQVENLDELGVNSGGTTAKVEEPHDEARVVGASPTTKTNQNIATEPAKTFCWGREARAL